MSEKPKQHDGQRRSHFFPKCHVLQQCKSCNEWVSAYSLVFQIHLLFLVMLIRQLLSLRSQLIAKINLQLNKYSINFKKNVVAKHSLYTFSSVLYSGNIEIKPCIQWLLTEGLKKQKILKLSSKKVVVGPRLCEVQVVYERFHLQRFHLMYMHMQ